MYKPCSIPHGARNDRFKGYDLNGALNSYKNGQGSFCDFKTLRGGLKKRLKKDLKKPPPLLKHLKKPLQLIKGLQSVHEGVAS